MMNIEEFREKYLYIYANIFFAKGYTRTMICDLKKSDWEFIPNDYFQIIKYLKLYKIGHIIDNFVESKSLDAFNYFLSFILDSDYGIFVDDIHCFPEISLRWDSPSLVENAIIDISEKSSHNFKKIAQELHDLNCKDLQLRFYYQIENSIFIEIIDSLINMDFRSIHFIIPYNENISKDYYLNLGESYPSSCYTIYESPHSELIKSKLDGIYPIVGYVQYTKQKIKSSCDCGIINKESFTKATNPSGFIEGMSFNKCLNRKISIDHLGFIKNCPSMDFHFGNINDCSLPAAYNKAGFSKMWYINKDMISICKDCEYRYVCSDCRAFVKGLYDKPLKCNYDPYLGKWL